MTPQIVTAVLQLFYAGRNDLTTEQGRAAERKRRALLSTLTAMAAKLLGVGASLLTIPLTLGYLGPERFGLWMAITSFVAMLGFADLGIGNGLLNAVSEANGKEDAAAMRSHISSAAFTLTLIAGVVVIVFALASTHISWAAFFNISSPLVAQEAGPTMAVLVVCFALNILVSVAPRVQLGLQMGFVANAWQALGSLMALVAVLVAVHLQAGLPWLVLGIAGTPVIAAAMNGYMLFFRIRPDLRPRIAQITRSSTRMILRTGLLFFVLQIVVAVTYASDNFIIAQTLGVAEVTNYAVPDKMFSVITMIVSMMLAPLWPAYGEALARGDVTWVRNILRKSLLVAIGVSATLSLILVVFGNMILTLWLRHPVEIPFVLLLGFGVWKVLEGIGNSVSMFLNGANIIRPQLVFAVVTAVVAIALKLYFVKSLGVATIIWSTSIAFLFFCLLPYSFLIRKVIREAHEKR